MTIIHRSDILRKHAGNRIVDEQTALYAGMTTDTVIECYNGANGGDCTYRIIYLQRVKYGFLPLPLRVPATKIGHVWA